MSHGQQNSRTKRVIHTRCFIACLCKLYALFCLCGRILWPGFLRFHRHALAIFQVLWATIQAIERCELPIGDIGAAAEEETPQHEEGGEKPGHRVSSLPHCRQAEWLRE